MQMSNIKKEYKEEVKNEKKEAEIYFEKKYIDKLNNNNKFKNKNNSNIKKDDIKKSEDVNKNNENNKKRKVEKVIINSNKKFKLL